MEEGGVPCLIAPYDLSLLCTPRYSKLAKSDGQRQAFLARLQDPPEPYDDLRRVPER